ncbi:hypothetical protein AB6N01_01160 [Alcaligenes nematophilus]|uniref:hypothetical protein n=1 Tax=Alcaligenes nematophilus TaxID=2994643 RepID=UPI0034E09D91
MLKPTTLAIFIVLSSILLAGCGEGNKAADEETALYNQQLEQQNKVRSQIK